MQIRTLGRSGLAVSELCLGTMSFGNTTSEADAIRMIHQFKEQGGNFWIRLMCMSLAVRKRL
ncbi:hypothetical protein LOZ80_07605 [Paenibacillus sp. HWE-109]|uniref:hypothetical protein n=1 Tax=Paenibacillus sp. HWE-109 TaxID=1306526 RepID=UPI001EDCB348|nr:hypothetical protein [Paenibacillus sp. HWE-109]UKS28780.1 hypothetical protein LOZ80_07605 [Paenibacillus sp. HWE-109]